MKKLSILALGVFLIGCESKTVSFEYYNSHIQEAQKEVKKCSNSQDENAQSCQNARMAVEKDNEKKQEQQILNNM